MTRYRNWTRRAALPLCFVLLCLSLAANAVLLGGRAPDPGAIRPVPSAPDSVELLREELAQERREREKLYAKISQMATTLIQQKESQKSIRARYAALSDQLQSTKAENQRLRAGSPVQRTTAPSDPVLYRGAETALAQAVADTADRIAARASRTATRRIGTMAGEGLPWLGTSVAGAVATMDLADLCTTIRDVAALHKALDPTAGRSAEELTVCSLPVPRPGDVWNAVQSDPERAWQRALEFAPALLTVQGADMPAIDWLGYRTAAMGEGLRIVAEASGTDAESLRAFLSGFEALTRPVE